MNISNIDVKASYNSFMAQLQQDEAETNASIKEAGTPPSDDSNSAPTQ